MNESDTRLHKIDPQLKAAGWDVVDGSRITTEYYFTLGKVSKTVKNKPKKADYVLIYRNVKLAIVEAKSDEVGYKEGIAQAKGYASTLDIRFTYAADGDHVYEIDRDPHSGGEHEVDRFPTPEELWHRQFGKADYWRDKFRTQPFYQDSEKHLRYYQEIAVNHVLDAIAWARNASSSLWPRERERPSSPSTSPGNSFRPNGTWQGLRRGRRFSSSPTATSWPTKPSTSSQASSRTRW